jgi:hypothetical protein
MVWTLSVGCFAAALLWKETAAGFPVLVAVHVFLVPHQRNIVVQLKAAMMASLPFWMVLAGYLLLRFRLLGVIAAQSAELGAFAAFDRADGCHSDRRLLVEAIFTSALERVSRLLTPDVAAGPTRSRRSGLRGADARHPCLCGQEDATGFVLHRVGVHHLASGHGYLCGRKKCVCRALPLSPVGRFLSVDSSGRRRSLAEDSCTTADHCGLLRAGCGGSHPGIDDVRA